MKHFKEYIALVLGLLGASAFAQFDYRELSVPWSSSAATYIGSGIDVDLINQNRNICLDNSGDRVQWLDGAGALSTEATIELVSSYKALERTLGLEVDYKSKGSVNMKAIKAGASVDLNIKYSQMAKDESRSLAIVVKGQSNFGRRGLTKYEFLPEFKALLTNGQLDTFRARCGTHSVVAQQNEVMVAVVILVTDLTSSTKSSLEGLYKSSVNASGTIKMAEVSGSSDKSVAWKNVVETAFQLGSVSVTFASRGGTGVADALKVLTVPNPREVANIVQTINGLGPSFTQANSAPVKYLLISNAALGYAAKVSDPSKLDTLNSYYLQLSRVDYALERVNGYQQSFPALHAAQYANSASVLSLRSYRKQLVDAIEACVISDKCDYRPPEKIAVLFLEDILLPDSVELSCSYQRVSSQNGKVQLDVLNNTSVVLRGRARLLDYIGLPSAVLARFGPDSTPPRKMVTAWQAYALSPNTAADGTAKLLAQLDNQAFKADLDITEQTVFVKNAAQLEHLRNDILGSVYAVNIQAANGTFIRNTVGPPFAKDCPVTKQVAQH
jgi:hypothetical protein